MISKTENRKCDRCGASSRTIDGEGESLKLHTISVGVEVHIYGRRGVTGKKADWCTECCERTGLILPPKPKNNEPTPKIPEPPTIEDMLRELAREEAEQVIDYRG